MRLRRILLSASLGFTASPDGLSRLPLAFVENRGQWDTVARFVARRGGLTCRVEPGALVLQMERGLDNGIRSGVLLRLGFEGADPRSAIEGENETSGIYNFFYGNDPGAWVTEVPGHASALYRGLYPGVDLRVREQGRDVAYDLLLAPGADLARVVVRVEGADRLRLDPDGSLVLETALGPIRQRPPTTWEVVSEESRRPLPSRFHLLDETRFGFAVDGWEGDLPLVVDPGIEWSTFLGGTEFDQVSAMALDPSGAVVLTGYTTSRDFPVTPGAYDVDLDGPSDVFVTRLSATGSALVISTFLGGSLAEFPSDVDLDGSGGVVVGGVTYSTDFPTTPGAFDPSFNGGQEDGFVLRLNATGTSLLFGTYVGGSNTILSICGSEAVSAVAASPSGEVTVAGWTISGDFPTTAGAYSTTLVGPGGWDGFVSRLDSGGSTLLYSTFFGGPGTDRILELDVDATGAAAVAGWTNLVVPVTPGAFDVTFNGPTIYDPPCVPGDIFVARLDATGSTLLYGTYLGGSLGDVPTALALDDLCRLTVAGRTISCDFPTTPGAFQPNYAGCGAPTGWSNLAFVARFDPSGSALEYSTFLGGTSLLGFDSVEDMAVDSSGSVVLAGWTSSNDFPTTPGAHDTTLASSDAIVARLRPDGSDLVYSTFLGGSGADSAWTLVLDGSGAATVAGITTSANFPLSPAAIDPVLAGYEGFVTRLDLLPAGVTKYGASTPGCAGPLAIGVTSWPQVGNGAFSITCTNGPPNSTGTLGVGFAPASPPFFVAGVLVALDPFATLFLDATTNALGASEVSIPIPSDPLLVGGAAYAQFFWISPCAPGGVSASNALAIVVQP